MYNLFEQNDMLDTMISIEQIRQNASREPLIKLDYNMYRLTSYWKSPSIYFYVGLQAISKCLNNTLYVHTARVQGKGTELERNMNYAMRDCGSGDYIEVLFCEIAPSNITKSTIRHKREDFGTTVADRDSAFRKMSGCQILGTTVAHNNNSMIIFLEKEKEIGLISTMLLLILIYRCLNRTAENQKVAELFRDLSSYVANKTYTADIESGYEQLHNIFLNYIKDLPEYTIDQRSALNEALRKIRERSLERARQECEYAIETLNNLMDRLQTARKDYDDANLKYTALLDSGAIDKQLQTLQETVEMLYRSPAVTETNIDGTVLWFTVRQPLRVNDKENWKRISENLFPNEKARECVNKALVDGEFKLYTICRMQIDFEYMNFGKASTNPSYAKEIPQPHIAEYRCFGNHSSVISRLIREGKFLEAVEQCIEAAAGMNWSDGPVTGSFSRKLVDRYKCIPCFETKSGKRFSLNDYLGDKIDETV